MKLDLLAMAAHPDDVELTCGGTLIKMARRGYSVGILDLTGGEMGTRGSAETRRKEAAAAGRILGVKHRENLGLPDARLEMRMEYKMAIAGRIRALRPRTVILPYWEGRHPDHYTASRLGYEGCFLAGLKRLDLDGEAYRPFKVLYSTTYDRTVRPSFVVDISGEFSRQDAGDFGVRVAIPPEGTRAALKSVHTARPAGARGALGGAILWRNGRRGICRAIPDERSYAGGRCGGDTSAVDLEEPS